MPKVTLRYLGQIGSSGYGWATCNNALFDELSKLCEMRRNGESADVAFVPVANHKLEPASPVRGSKWTLGYCFFESPLEPEAAANAKQYDILFCGSTWCLERLREKGITNGQVLIQGVDHNTFRPMDVPRSDNSFRIFSGGKFEYRKGQDIVIAAFRELCKRHGNLKLVTAWHNPWPDLMSTIVNQSPHIKRAYYFGSDQQSIIKHLLNENGVDPERAEIHGPLTQPELAAVMNSTDLGVFPNRCEGGTNLVLMEYLSCGKPAVGSTQTGHWDLSFRNHELKPGWDEINPNDLAARIELAMAGDVSHWPSVEQFTWQCAARQIVEAIEKL